MLYLCFFNASQYLNDSIFAAKPLAEQAKLLVFDHLSLQYRNIFNYQSIILSFTKQILESKAGIKELPQSVVTVMTDRDYLYLNPLFWSPTLQETKRALGIMQMIENGLIELQKNYDPTTNKVPENRLQDRDIAYVKRLATLSGKEKLATGPIEASFLEVLAHAFEKESVDPDKAAEWNKARHIALFPLLMKIVFADYTKVLLATGVPVEETMQRAEKFIKNAIEFYIASFKKKK